MTDSNEPGWMRWLDPATAAAQLEQARSRDPMVRAARADQERHAETLRQRMQYDFPDEYGREIEVQLNENEPPPRDSYD